VVLYPFMGHLNEDEIARGNYQQLVSPWRYCALCSGTE
jgi:hypothetical protein